MSAHALRRHAPVLVGAALLLLFSAIVWYLLHDLLADDGSKSKKTVQQISLIKPPPPPPPPKVEEKPPEPEIKEEVKIDEPPPENNDDEPPPGQDLGVDADGGAGGDGFGLIGRKGGRDLMSSRFGWYGNLVQSDIYDALMRDEDTRKSSYSVVVKLWLGTGGEVQRVELEGSSGDVRIDESIKRAVSGLSRVAEAPPADLPQPIKLRIATRI